MEVEEIKINEIFGMLMLLASISRKFLAILMNLHKCLAMVFFCGAFWFGAGGGVCNVVVVY